MAFDRHFRGLVAVWRAGLRPAPRRIIAAFGEKKRQAAAQADSEVSHGIEDDHGLPRGSW